MEFLKLREKEVYRSGKFSFNLLCEELRPIYLTFAMKPYSPLYEKFDETIQKLCQGGFCYEKLAGLHPKKISYKDTTMDNDKVPALILSIDDLGIGFEICSIPATLSVIAFVAEVLTSKAKKMIRLLGHAFVSNVVIKSFYKKKIRTY